MANFHRDYDKKNQSTSAVKNYDLGGIHVATPHHNHAAEYQMSGVPFVAYHSVGTVSADSIIDINFPYVTRWVFLRLAGTLADVKVGFSDASTSAGVQGTNYIGANSINAITVPLELKCKNIKVFIPNTVNDIKIEVLAGLTNIRDFPDISGAGISGISTTAAIVGSATANAELAVFVKSDAAS